MRRGPVLRNERLPTFWTAVAIGLVGALGAILAFSSPSDAAPFTPNLERVYRVALRFWGQPPVGCSSIEKEIVPNDSLGPGVMAEATQPAPGEVIPCQLLVARELAKPSNVGRACGFMVHEVGHLDGLGHSSNPESVMYPTLHRLPNVCWNLVWKELDR